MNAADLLELSLAQAARLVRTREVSPLELVDACLARIDAVDSRLAAYITVFADEARSVAKAADTMLRAGYDLGPLHGVPISLKDNLAVARHTHHRGQQGAGELDPRSRRDRHRAPPPAGAILLGKLNMHEFAWGGTSDNPHYGAVRNPWNTERFPAGSSGGSGVAVAARTCYGAIGTDTGGSIRLPSAINGVVGIRPTYGRVSNHGIIPLAWSMDTAGPMTRTVEDCALMVRRDAGHDPKTRRRHARRRPTIWRILTSGIDGLRIGVVPGYFFHHLQPPVHAAVMSALDTPEGPRREDRRRRHRQHPRQHLGATHDRIRRAEHLSPALAARATAELRRRRTDASRSRRAAARDALPAGAALPHPAAQRVHGSVPQGRRVPLPHPALHRHARRRDEGGDRERRRGRHALGDHAVHRRAEPDGPAFAGRPCGFDPDGLPIGMQVIGKPFDEATLFRVGAAYQGVTEFHTKAPRL